MPGKVPISRHLDLFRYWTAKRGARPLPTRRDLDPAEMRGLLPHVALVDRERGFYRWRLMGTAIAGDIGRDLTGQRCGGHVGTPDFIAALAATFDRVLGDGRPMFEDSLYVAAAGVLHSVSRLLLPLAAGDGVPAMVLLTRISRFHHDPRADRDWLKGAAGTVRGAVAIASFEDLAASAAAWEREADARPLEAPGAVRRDTALAMALRRFPRGI